MNNVPGKSPTPVLPSGRSGSVVSASSGINSSAATVTNSETPYSQAFLTDRKRRDNINEKIQELLTLIPNDYFQEYYHSSGGNDSSAGLGVSTTGDGSSVKLKGTGTRDGKPNKGQILTQAVEYILRLQRQVDAKNRQEIELIVKLRDLSGKTGMPVKGINLDHTSAEIELAKIGVGPLAGMPPAARDRLIKDFRN